MSGKVLVTGAAGFIGAAVSRELGVLGYAVVGVDNLNDYYDPRLKLARLAHNGIKFDDCSAVGLPHFGAWKVSALYPGLRFARLDITDREQLPLLFEREGFDYVINLAAQAGVRYSTENPWAYVDNNIVGILNVLECCRHYPVKHLVYASSSSVYGGSDADVFSEGDRVDEPVSLYAATKKSTELLAYTYARMYGIRAPGLRYFTVYGPWGRPDMAPMLFADAISRGEAVKVFNNGDMTRDFTFIDDVVGGTIATMKHVPVDDANGVPSAVYNIGCGHPVKLMDFVAELERVLGNKAVIEYLPMQTGDVYKTSADTSRLAREVGYSPRVEIAEGVRRFIDWYREWSKTLD